MKLLLTNYLVSAGLVILISLSILTPGCFAEKALEVKVGAIYPFSGTEAETAQEIKNALTLAADIANDVYDLGLPLAGSPGLRNPGRTRIKLVFADSRGSPESGRSEAIRLIDEEKVSALIGCYQSAVTEEASKAAEQRHIPFICDISTAPGLTLRAYDWFFRTTPDDELFVNNYSGFLTRIKQEAVADIDSLAFVYEDSIWGKQFASYAKLFAIREGYQVAADIAYPSSTTDVSPYVQVLKATDPDVVMQASYAGDALLFIQEYKKQHFSPQGILTMGAGFEDPGFINASGADSNFVISRTAWSLDWAQKDLVAGKVNEKYFQKFKKDLNSNSARAFTGLSVLADALSRAEKKDPEGIRKALLETDLTSVNLIMPWKGVKFDAVSHQNVRADSLIGQIQDRRYRTVWPSDKSSVELVWPFPAWNQR